MKENLRTIVIALLIAFGVRTVAFEPFKIPSESMLPNLLVGDFLFVSKYSYGYSKYSIIFAPIPFKGRIFSDDPERGDVAVFHNGPTGVNFIKRVIGVPGDVIEVQRGRVVINGERLDIAPAIHRVDRDARRPANYYTEELPVTQEHPEGRSHLIRVEASGGPWGRWEVPEGHFFMMGDNRDNSLDSRVSSAVGFVPLENFIGRAEILFFSIDMDGAPFYHFWRWPFAIRYDRLFDRIE